MKTSALDFIACPACKGSLESSEKEDADEVRAGVLLCKRDGTTYTINQGIPELILPARREQAKKQAEEIRAVRTAQGLDIEDWGYYIRLPYPGERITISGNLRKEPSVPTPLLRLWEDRAAAFEILYNRIRFERAGRVLDLGAGCTWLTSRIANRFNAIAIDIDAGQFGLGMAEAYLRSGKHYERAAGELANIPVRDSSMDLVICAASIEFEDLSLSIPEIRRSLKPGGSLYILDTPIFLSAKGFERGRGLLEKYYTTIGAGILAQRHQAIFLDHLLEELKTGFRVELIPAERKITAAKRSFLSIIRRKEMPIYPIIKATKIS